MVSVSCKFNSVSSEPWHFAVCSKVFIKLTKAGLATSRFIPFGALLGSITMVLIKLKKNSACFMIINIFLMHLLIIVFATLKLNSAVKSFYFSGYIQSLAMISLVVTLLAVAKSFVG